jgi:hypothetical protein
MPLKKLLFKPGVNRENTRYTNEGGYYESEKIRFRQGTPEKIGGWLQVSSNKFLGICRSLWSWVTLAAQSLIGVGTNLKFYILNGGAYYDITPIRKTSTVTNPFSVTTTSNVGSWGYLTWGADVWGGSPIITDNIITVTDNAHGATNGSYITIYYPGAAPTVGGLTIPTGEYVITYLSANTYTITVSGTATSTATGGGTVYISYQVNAGPEYAVPLVGWGAGAWSSGTWGNSGTSTIALQLWNQMNYGQNLLYGPRGSPLYYWDANTGYQNTAFSVTLASPAVLTLGYSLVNGTAVTLTTTGWLPTGLIPGTVYYVINASGTTCNLSATYGGSAINTSGSQSGTQSIAVRGYPLASIGGSDGYAPLYQNTFTVSDASRFILVFGTNDIGSTTLDPMLIRWSDQDSLTTWYPAITNQAGSVRLSHGSKIITTVQSRQEIVVFTDSSLYSLQYLGPPYVWSSQLLGDGLSIAGPNAVILASGVVYWLGTDKFYKYDGRIQTLSCDLRQYVFNDINQSQSEQFFASTNEGFNEVWWFYCSANSTVIDKYIIYNYLENIWYYGTMGRTAWLDSGLNDYPIAATYSKNLVWHENGVNDCTDSVTGLPIPSYILSSQFDIDDGHNFGFVWRMLPDLKFDGSTAASPQVTMTLYPMQNSGSGYNSPLSVGGNAYATSTRTSVYPIEAYTGQIYTRVRGRQMAFKIEGNQLGLQWQLGAPRLDIRNDGRR